MVRPVRFARLIDSSPLPANAPSPIWSMPAGSVSAVRFRAFAKAQDYPLASNAMANADPLARAENPHPDMMGIVIPSGSPSPENYLSYCCIHRNNGGMVLVYDKDRQVLYGWYMHH